MRQRLLHQRARAIRLALVLWLSIVVCDPGPVASARPQETPGETPQNAGQTVAVSKAAAHAAASVTVQTPEPVRLTVEWLGMSADGQLNILASRLLEGAGPFQLPRAQRVGRFVRFHRDGASPITVRADDLYRDAQWQLPAARPGGELFVHVQAAPILPNAYRIEGPATVDADPRGHDAFSVHGLAPGTYALVPRYAGGLSGSARRAIVERGRSTALFFTREAVGAVVAAGAPATCQDAVYFSIDRVTRTSGSGGIREELLRTNEVSTCRWTVAGLPAGTYEARLEGTSGSSGGQSFTIAPQAVTQFQLRAPRVNVVGTVASNGHPLAAADLLWMRSEGGLTRTTTDASGQYRVTLDAAGSYSVSLNHSTLRTQTRLTTLQEGENTFDWSVNGGKLMIRLKGWDQTAKVVVNITTRTSSNSLVLQPGDGSEISHGGLAFDTYAVTAYQEQGRAARREVRAQIDESHPEAVVDVELVDRRGRLLLKDALGQAVAGATFPNTYPTPVEQEPGTYSLNGLGSGAQVRIRPPAELVPVCRTMADEDLDVTLTVGRSALLELPAGFTMIGQLGAAVGLNGSDCPVPIADFRPSQESSRPGEPLRFMLHGIPMSDAIVFEGFGRRRTLVFAESGRAVLR